MNSNTLKLRSRFATSHQLPVNTLDCDLFQAQLNDTLAKAPSLFHLAPTILDLSELTDEISTNQLESILHICCAAKLVPFALTGDRERHKPVAEQMSLAWLDYKAGNATKNAKPEEKLPEISQTKVITTPIRSGQQIYARDAHLLIMNQVSAGAEVIADGNIHIFGALRGRAIAGAQGVLSSEIVCQQMAAELIAITGTYLVQDDFPSGEGAARCWLDGDHISIDYL